MKWCWLFGHVQFVGRELSPVCRIVHCAKCPQQWIMNDSHQAMIPFGEDAKKFVALMYGVKL